MIKTGFNNKIFTKIIPSIKKTGQPRLTKLIIFSNKFL